MDLLLMRSLLAVADHGVITDAAGRIGISQPALSRRLQLLEEHMGASLFVRSRNGVTLTELGRLVEAEARVLVGRYDSLRQRIDAYLNLSDGIVRIGGGATAVSFLLPAAIASFQSAHRDIRFHVKEAGSREIAADVASGQLELGVVTLPVQTRDLLVAELMTDEVVLVGQRDHPLVRQRRRTDIERDLAGRPYVGFEGGSAIRQIIDGALRGAGIEMNVVMELRSIPAILRMVSSTGYLAFVSRASLAGQADIVEIAVPGLKIARRLAVVHRADVPLSPAAQAFSTHLRQPVASQRPRAGKR
ncbi:MAG: LysR family transcriptional regulator [Burkholderiaceae bacterium]